METNKKKLIHSVNFPQGWGKTKGFEIKKIILTGVLTLTSALMGCSVTSLHCGVDGDSSFVQLHSTPNTLAQNARIMAELCAFAYEAPDAP